MFNSKSSTSKTPGRFFSSFGAGFAIHWLFIVAIVLALLWLISLFTGGIGRRGGAL